MKLLTISEFAELAGVSRQNIRKSAINPNSKLNGFVQIMDGKKYIADSALFEVYGLSKSDEVVKSRLSKGCQTEEMTTRRLSNFENDNPKVVKNDNFEVVKVDKVDNPNFDDGDYQPLPLAISRKVAPLTLEQRMVHRNIYEMLERDKNNVPKNTRDNFMIVMQNDQMFSRLRFNELSHEIEVHDKNGVISPWQTVDEAGSRVYLESFYKLSNNEKYTDALTNYCSQRAYNPVKQIIESVEWDGVNRCEEFLIKWAKVDDSEYAREVSRLIFAGGINRMYRPGCKFDEVPVLIGTSQGEGKSTLVRFLAINNTFEGECNSFEGQPSIEQLSGKWICEISEMLALTKSKEQEAAKAYLTRNVDYYRKPYERTPSTLPRRCIFIGTSNRKAGLFSDMTGNRRYYPIEVHSDGHYINQHEEEIREYILQCWAEALERFQMGNMPPYADQKLINVFRDKQSAATLDDWRIGVIEEYLSHKPIGYAVCIREITRKCLYPESPKDPNRLEAVDIGIFLDKMVGWECDGKRRRTEEYGQQKCWVKVANPFEEVQNTDEDEQLPLDWRA